MSERIQPGRIVGIVKFEDEGMIVSSAKSIGRKQVDTGIYCTTLPANFQRPFEEMEYLLSQEIDIIKAKNEAERKKFRREYLQND